MKTTLVIDDGLMRRVKALAAQRRLTLSAVVESFLRRGLRAERASAEEKRSRAIPVFDMGPPLVDLGDRAALEAAIERAERVRR